MKKIAAVTAALVATVALAAPAQASQSTDLNDVRFMTTMGKAAWGDISQSARDGICTWFYIAPYEARNELARGFYEDVYEYEFSLYDAKRAAWRILNWAC